MRPVAVLATGLSLVAAALAAPALAAQPSAPALTVFAASDLAFAFRELVPLFERATGARVTLVLGSTGQMAKQIEHGAPADVFFAADETFVDGLRERGAVIAASRTLYAQGRIVLASSQRAGLALRELGDLLGPEVKRVAIANPEHAPYGRAAREALTAAGVWDRVRPKLVYGENIRQALQYVQSGAVEAGIVALSVADVPEIRHVAIAAHLHRPLNQVAAVTARSPRPELAMGFLAFVAGPEGRAVMQRYGFRLPGEF